MTLLVILGFIAYLIPSFVATSNKKKNAGAIFALNLLLGWTFIGWIVALIWALRKDDDYVIKVSNASESDADEIKKLLKLREEGVLTEEEFQTKKEKILSR